MSAVSSPGVERGAAAGPTCSDPSTSWPLPVELLLQCLLASDMATRIRASHQHEDSMFSLLEAMLLRSRPLPFHLTVPHFDGRPRYDYTARLLGLKELNVFRLAAYHGPTRLFRLLNPACAPLPNLICLDVLRLSSDCDPDITTIDLVAQFGAHFLPNLRKLAAPNVRFPADGAPFGALQNITLDGVYGHHHRGLFRHCPSLVSMNITNSARSTPLPDPPVPPTLEEVFIGCSAQNELDLLALMKHWRGVRVCYLVAHEVYSLEGVLPLFLASHERPIELRMPGDDDQKVVLSTTPVNESIWTISPSPDWANYFLEDIENPVSDRLTSLCVAFSQLSALLAAQLHAPGLEKLEIRVDSASDAEPPALHAGDEIFLRAPRLRSVSFALGDDSPDSLEDALDVLCTSFRGLFVYDAVLLDTITVSHCAERACADFAPFAEEFVLDQKGS